VPIYGQIPILATSARLTSSLSGHLAPPFWSAGHSAASLERLQPLGPLHLRSRCRAAFLRWCEARGVRRLQDVQLVHVAYIEQLQGQRSAPTVKQHLAGIRMLFDWLVTVAATIRLHSL
jgi:hypothetical protein